MSQHDTLTSNVDAIMEQAQVFASAWSLIGGRLDKGGMFEEANDAKAELREMVSAALSATQPDQAAQSDWSTQRFNAPVYPPDGTESPFTVINLGSGKVQMGDSIHDGRLPAIWFGINGQGMGHEETMNREAHPGETLAVVTFANVEGLDVLLDVIQRIRREKFPEAQAAQGGHDHDKAAAMVSWVAHSLGYLRERLSSSHDVDSLNRSIGELYQAHALLKQPPAQPAAAQGAGEVVPYAYAVYFPDQPTEMLVHDLDDLCEDMTNREHTVTQLYTQPAAGADVLDAASPVGDWSYSHDEERFSGQFSTREEAIEEAVSCGARFIGRVRHARDFISDEMIGGDIRERISEILGDEVGEVAECFSMTSDQERELGKVVLDWIEAGPGFNCWGIKDVEPIDAAIAASGRKS